MTNTSSTTTRTLLAVLALAAALSTAACATDDVRVVAQGDGTAAIALEARAYLGPQGAATELRGLGDEPVQLEGSACTCTSDACVADYIRDHVGCDVCVAFACEDGRRVGGCAACGQ